MKLIDNYIFGLKRKLLCCIEESCPALPLIVALTYGCNTVCSYCNAQGLKEKFEEEINVDDFKKVLSWMKRQRIKKIMFTGGEPTLHSRFKEIIELCREERIMCYMASHGYYAEAMNDFVGKNINVLFINCSTEYALKEKNDFTSKLCKLKEYGVKIILRINVNNSNDDLTWYLELAKTLNARVRIGITNPPLFKAESIDIKRIEELLSVIEEFARKCLQEKIYLYLARPVPRCMFDDKKWQELRHLMLIKSKCLVGYRGNFASRIVVNPDLSVFGCFNNQKKADNILRFNDLEKLNEFYTNDFKKHISHCILGLAHNCKYFNRGECYGACFAYKKNK